MSFTYSTTQGRKVTVGESLIFGLASNEEDFIWINENQGSREKLGTYIHEWLHIEFPRRPEWMVVKHEKLLATGLWRAGLRKRKGDGVESVKTIVARIVGRACKYWAVKTRPAACCLADYLYVAGYRGRS